MNDPSAVRNDARLRRCARAHGAHGTGGREALRVAIHLRSTAGLSPLELLVPGAARATTHDARRRRCTRPSAGA